MKILVDRDYLLPYFTVVECRENEPDKRVRFEIGDMIDVFLNTSIYNKNGNQELSISEQTSKYHILNITSKVIVLEAFGRCSYVKIKDLEKRIKLGD